jgi:UDP-N-acetylmuramyl pentapeptide phosphotransferase/UDP-N-acetylglucosamine-1-phosphate transferase
MIYLMMGIVLFVVELLYFRIAEKYRIIDKPNERSSHTRVTLRGGGIIYWVAALLYVVSNHSQQSAWFFGGITIIAAVSFWDDVKGTSQKIRLVFHLVAMTCAFYAVHAFGVYPWWAIAIGYVVFMGIVNAYNFMDGINGITGLYSLVVLGTLQYVNMRISPFVDPNMIWFPMLASAVFLFFNFRKKARCFAGDIGSVSIAFWIVFLLLSLMIQTQNLIWIGFLLVYGVDSVCTILHRIYLKQNIMEAHRLHFYQILANEYCMPHRLVSLIYAAVQLVCSALIIRFYPTHAWSIFTFLALVLVAVYSLKFKLMKQTAIINKKRKTT